MAKECKCPPPKTETSGEKIVIGVVVSVIATALGSIFTSLRR